MQMPSEPIDQRVQIQNWRCSEVLSVAHLQTIGREVVHLLHESSSSPCVFFTVLSLKLVSRLALRSELV